MVLITREKAHIECLSRDCSCIEGRDRDSNYHETIDKIYDCFESRVCENCKFPKRIAEDEDYEPECSIHLIPCSSIEGCNKFEPKGA